MRQQPGSPFPLISSRIGPRYPSKRGRIAPSVSIPSARVTLADSQRSPDFLWNDHPPQFIYGSDNACRSQCSCASLTFFSHRFSMKRRFMPERKREDMEAKNGLARTKQRAGPKTNRILPIGHVVRLPNFSHSGKRIFPFPRVESTMLCSTMNSPSIAPLAIS